MPEARVSRVGREMKKFPGMSTSHACRRGSVGSRGGIAVLTIPLRTRCLARVHMRCSRGLDPRPREDGALARPWQIPRRWNRARRPLRRT